MAKNTTLSDEELIARAKDHLFWAQEFLTESPNIRSFILTVKTPNLHDGRQVEMDITFEHDLGF